MATTTTTQERHRLALPLNFQVGPYRIMDQLGFGSFGITYKAMDQRLSRLVAIKELLPTMIASRIGNSMVQANDPSEEKEWEWAKSRFVEEAQTLAACEHRNVLNVYETFSANGTAYLVTRFEEGCTLSRWMRNLGRRPTEAEVRSILDPLLAALETVHAHRFLHRDIKPDNIYMRNSAEPVLIDFGSARQAVVNRSTPMTAIVTEGYAPFEQYTDAGEQGPWTDLYALGAVLYSLIAGKRPPTAPERAAAGANDPCLRLATAFAGQYSERLLRSVDTALMFHHLSRFQHTGHWQQALGIQGVAPGGSNRVPTFPVGAMPPPLAPNAPVFAPPTPPYAPAPASSSRPVLMWAGIGILILALVGAIGLLLSSKSDESKSVRAEEQRRQDEQFRIQQQQIEAIRGQQQQTADLAAQRERDLQHEREENSRLRQVAQATPYPPAPQPSTYSPPAAAYTAPAPPPPVQNTSIPSGFMDFFSTMWSHNVSADPAVWASDFASPCYYCYANGTASRSFIENDRRKLLSRFPNRSYSKPEIENVTRLGDDQARMTYTFSYQYSGAKHASGSSRVTFTGTRSGGRWQITSFDESVNRR